MTASLSERLRSAVGEFLALRLEAADEIDRLNKWADGFSDAQLKERRLGEELDRERRAEIARLQGEVAALDKECVASVIEIANLRDDIVRLRALPAPAIRSLKSTDAPTEK